MRSIDELAAEICTLAGHINAANHRLLMLIAEFDRRNGWSDGATQSCAHWLNWKCGIAMGAAREKVRVARALENLPKISAAMACGKLSYSKAREITRVANAETEDYLLMIAEHGTAQHVEKLVRAYRRCQEAEELSREARQQQNRSVQLPLRRRRLTHPELPAAGRSRRAGHEGAGSRGRRTCPLIAGRSSWNVAEPVPFSARRADALALVAESFLAHDVHGSPRHRSPADRRARRRGDLARPHRGLLRVRARPFDGRGNRAPAACDASVVALIENDDGEPLNVGRKTRTISAPLRRLLNARDKGCRFPGCANTRYIDAHHIKHWANGGETKPSNLVSLCRFHHRAVHEGGIRIEILDDGALRFVKPNGEPSTASRPAARSRSVIGGSCRPEPLVNSLERRADGLRSRRRGADAAGKAGERTFQRERRSI